MPQDRIRITDAEIHAGFRQALGILIASGRYAGYAGVGWADDHDARCELVKTFMEVNEMNEVALSRKDLVRVARVARQYVELLKRNRVI